MAACIGIFMLVGASNEYLHAFPQAPPCAVILDFFAVNRHMESAKTIATIFLFSDFGTQSSIHDVTLPRRCIPRAD